MDSRCATSFPITHWQIKHMKFNTIRRWVLAAIFVAAVGGTAMADPVMVPEFSFETATNWFRTGNGGVGIQTFTNTLFEGTDVLPAPADGTNCFVENINGHPAFCWQTIGQVQTNTHYTLTVALGQSFTGGGGAGKIALINGTSPFHTVLAEQMVDTYLLTPGTFSDVSLSFTAGYQAGGSLTILLQGDSGAQLFFDNVRLDAVALPLAPTAVLPVLSTPSSTVYRGTLVTLTEIPAGAAPFTYRWQSDNGSGGASFADVPGATGASLVVDTAGFTVGMPVQYRAVVDNGQGTSTSPAVALTAIEGAPVIIRDALPTMAFDVEGGEVTFTVSVDGSRPMTYQWYKDYQVLPGATGTTLTLGNLQVADSGFYYLEAANEFGPATSALVSLTVNPQPADVGGVIISPASQLGFGTTNTFSPTWILAANSLIEGVAPSSSVGNFTLERAGGIPVLTDGRYGTLPPEGNASVELATCGRSANEAGSSIVYPLPAAPNGYDLTNVVIYGGWSDAGRDQQQYYIYYSTVANPADFANMIAYVNFYPTNDVNAQSATRVTITGTNGVVARNAAAIKIDFDVLATATENGYTGYAEFQVFGKPSAPAPVLAVDTQPATGSDMEGGEVTFVAAFTSETPITFQWRVDKGDGPVDIPGATNTTLTLSNLQISDTGGYSLRASNASGSSFSKANSFVVYPLAGPDAFNVIVSTANQTGAGTTFSPTWSVPAANLIAGLMPSAKIGSVGSFMLEGAGGIPVLTDGSYGSVGSKNNSRLATCGSSGSAGHSLTYTLAGSPSGYDLTNIVIAAGWSDGGRDQQGFTVYYSTIADPNNFIALSSTDYNPVLPGTVPTIGRVSFTSAASAPLALNVAKVMFDFTSPYSENGYSGYSEIVVLGSVSAPLPIPPSLFADTLPAAGADVVGSEVTFTASFVGGVPMTFQWRKDAGSGPVDIPGATNASLTIGNLQISDSGAYSVVAANEFGSAASTPNSFTVNPAPAPANGILVAHAYQQSGGLAFTPTWAIAPGSLVAGLAPSSVGGGNFATEGGGGLPVLTDGAFGSVGGGNATLATAGVGAGTSATYTLAGSTSGYDLTRIVTFGGWGDSGRDEQHYTVAYSTLTAPDIFVDLASVKYNPTGSSSIPTADRVTIASETAAPMAVNVAAVRFTFTNPTGENGWSGYAELSLFGVPSAPLQPLMVQSATVADGNLTIAGAGGAPGAAYTILTSADATAPLSSWATNSVGAFDASGAFSSSIPIPQADPVRFFTIRVP